MRTGHKDRSALISDRGVVGSHILVVREIPPPIHAITPPPLIVTGGVAPSPLLTGHSTRNTPFGTGSMGG
jgi:hypothetical protein